MNVDPVLLVFAVVALAAIAVVVSKLAGGPSTPDVVAKPFLTGNEREFLGRLERALPEMRVHAQVAMGALLQPGVRRGNTREGASRHASIRGRYSQKICDFVLQSRATGEVEAVVELDDRTHSKAKDAQRDAMMARAGYRTIRWESRAKPTEEEIRRRILGEARHEHGTAPTRSAAGRRRPG